MEHQSPAYISFVDIIRECKSDEEIKLKVQDAIQNDKIKADKVFEFVCVLGDLQLAKQLTQYNVGEPEKYVCVACKYGNLDIVKFLFETVIKTPKYQDDEKYYMQKGFTYAYRNSQTHVVAYFTSRDTGNVMMINEQVITDAIQHSNLETIKILLDNCLVVFAGLYDCYERITNLLFDRYVYDVDLIELFITRNYISVYHTIQKICTNHKGMRNHEQSIQILQLLINKHSSGLTSNINYLELIYKSRNENIIEFLIAQAIYADGHASLLCRLYPDLRLLKMLVDKGAHDFNTLLYKVCRHHGECTNIIKYLVSMGATNINQCLDELEPFTTESATFLMQQGAYDANTVARRICHQNRIDKQLLLIVIKDGITNLDDCLSLVLRRSKDETIIELLIKHGAKNHDALSKQQTIKMLNLNCNINNQYSAKIKRIHKYRQTQVKNAINKMKISNYDINVTNIICEYIEYE